MHLARMTSEDNIDCLGKTSSMFSTNISYTIESVGHCKLKCTYFLSYGKAITVTAGLKYSKA